MTQYDQCGAIGATARIDYQRGEALDVIMLTTSKERERKDAVLCGKEINEGTAIYSGDDVDERREPGRTR